MSELVDKLRAIAVLKVGEPFPEWLGSDGSWGPPLSKLCGEAADELERCYAGRALLDEEMKRLRLLSGAVSDGQSAADIKADLTKHGRTIIDYPDKS